MKNKGFTLTELLAVIVILSVLALITSSAITGIYKDSKEDLYNTQIALIEASAKQWGSENKNLLPVANENATVITNYLLLSDIQESGILEEVINPKTGEEFTDNDIIIKVTATYNEKYSKNSVNYEVVTDGSEINDIKENNKYIISLPPVPVSFATDSWATIKANKNSDVYQVGNEREVEIDGTSYTVRIANKSTPSACSGANYSQTACGFVVEFVDIIETREMDDTTSNEGILTGSFGTNIGGYPATDMYTYLQGGLYNKLPNDLQSLIIDTKVISGHGSGDTANFITENDKLYLLSAHEVWEDDTGYDTAYDNTHQLEYYANNNVTTSENYSLAIKQYNGTNTDWWLRFAMSYSQEHFGVVFEGNLLEDYAGESYGVAPAFRI